MKIFVTVGMNPWPFDRLLHAIIPLCHAHQVFAQTGVSQITPPCPHQPYLSYAEAVARIQRADVVITHAGNTVRVAQRAGKVPIVMARQAPHEMANDHQVDYLRREEQTARLVAVWDAKTLPDLVARFPEVQRELLATRPLPSPPDMNKVINLLDSLWVAAQNDALQHRR